MQNFAVLDRVVLKYLYDNYSEQTITKQLLHIIMPFAYYQPYVADSSKPMPSELFIGRKEELKKIKDVNGVNIVYGGRQLGKSALLMKAKRILIRMNLVIALFISTSRDGIIPKLL